MAVWYGRGLAFECRRCRKCCGGAPGYVWVSPEEIARLSAALGLSPAAFSAANCRQVGGRASLRERADGDCVLLGPDGCTVYAARPTQCRTFPFWPENVGSAGSWDGLAGRCPGVGSGHVYTLDEIRAFLAGRC
jgi:Fe-S-cluster containining protein